MEWWVLLHVATAFWFVAGLAGRDVSMTRAARATDITSVQALTGAAGVFDRFFVVPGSITVLVAGLIAMVATDLSLGDQTWLLVALILFLTMVPLVPLVFLPRGRVFEAALAEAVAAGGVTPGLRAAFADPLVNTARWYERIVVAVIIVLMVTKPF
jgi:Predicted integral membrane protein (DUF2269)